MHEVSNLSATVEECKLKQVILWKTTQLCQKKNIFSQSIWIKRMLVRSCNKTPRAPLLAETKELSVTGTAYSFTDNDYLVIWNKLVEIIRFIFVIFIWLGTCAIHRLYFCCMCGLLFCCVLKFEHLKDIISCFCLGEGLAKWDVLLIFYKEIAFISFFPVNKVHYRSNYFYSETFTLCSKYLEFVSK